MRRHTRPEPRGRHSRGPALPCPRLVQADVCADVRRAATAAQDACTRVSVALGDGPISEADAAKLAEEDALVLAEAEAALSEAKRRAAEQIAEQAKPLVSKEGGAKHGGGKRHTTGSVLAARSAQGAGPGIRPRSQTTSASSPSRGQQVRFNRSLDGSGSLSSISTARVPAVGDSRRVSSSDLSLASPHDPLPMVGAGARDGASFGPGRLPASAGSPGAKGSGSLHVPKGVPRSHSNYK